MPKRLLPLLLLLFFVPSGIWAVATVRLEIRNRAANTISCWNTVVTMPDGLYWRTGCETGTPQSGFTNYICKITRTKLTPAEELAYKEWIAAGRPEIAGCQPTLTGASVQDERTPGSPPLTGHPKPSPGCYYSRMKCVQAPCDPIIVCPTPVPCDGPDGSACIFGSCPPCTGRLCPMVMCKEQEGICKNKQCVTTRPAIEPIVIAPVTPGVGSLLFTTSAPAPATPTPTCIPRQPCLVLSNGLTACHQGIPPGGWFCPETTITIPSPTPTTKHITTPTSTPVFTREVANIITILSHPKSSQSSSNITLADYNRDGIVDNYDLVMFILSHE